MLVLRCKLQEVQIDCPIENAERCTRQSALIAAKNVKYHSNLIQTDRSTAKTAGQREGPEEERDIKLET
jgi:hypothetical protein